ncbi:MULTISPECIES: hypothetical protein [unclassified Fusibacter]|uniref:hypothetical protein n=1 Tax=unclassified Fusibacter TaxID=2624464 RepID=UPI001011E93D|nr:MULTISPECIES: hypothetical protein [unclassified Fusibacter]MCK8060019.1 hypothetical protein [Fusibacter sp. A2]NPE22159.1 hypothetical protein [Fusibacter sp. A1]RXV60936.1 hypothetical protein DWB64_09960 [Fusibacter sp. A1]
MLETKTKQYILSFSFIIFITLTFILILNHEPWADEAQAWLLSQDLSIGQLLFHQLRYEGSPGLWHLTLHVLSSQDLPYLSMNLISGFFGVLSAFLIYRYSPFPFYVKVLLPFTYFIFYQYSIVARSYSMIVPLLFTLAILHPNRHSKSLQYSILLCLLANVSLHGSLISLALFMVFLYELFMINHKSITAVIELHWKSIVLFSFMASYLVIFLYPSDDVILGTVIRLNPLRSVVILLLSLVDSLGSNLWLMVSRPDTTSTIQLLKTALGLCASLNFVYLSMRFFWRSRTLHYLLFPFLLLYLLFTFKHVQFWHIGIITVLWIFVMWISLNTKQNSVPNKNAVSIKTINLSFFLIMSIQLIWSFNAIQYDMGNSYSASKDMANYIKETIPANSELYGSSYYEISLLPYFERNIYANHNEGSNERFWSWSISQPSMQLQKTPQVPIGSYLVISDRNLVDYYGNSYRVSDYDLEDFIFLKKFEGGLFWKNEPLETDNYYLFIKSF